MALSSRKTTLPIFAIWLAVSLLLYFCMFGETDDAGFHNGWLFSTRPGWLWLTIVVYCTIILLARHALAFAVRMLSAT